MDVKNILNQQVENVINEHWINIKKVFHENVGSVTLEGLKDDIIMETLFTTIYKQFPLSVRLIIKKDTFTQYCFKHRERFIGNTQEPIPEV